MDENMSPYPMRVEPGLEMEPSPFKSKPTVNRLALYHYQVKSWSDFKKKMKRGGGDGSRKDEEYFLKINRYVQNKR